MYRLLSLFLVLATASASMADSKPNILFLTVDDMSADSMESFGGKLKGTMPTMDALARESLCFQKAHVQVGNCYPSRNVMFSGRYPHNSGVEGFYKVQPISYPVLCDLMKEGGYYTAIRGKVTHSTPFHPYGWDDDLTVLRDGTKAHMKDAESYYVSTKTGIENAKKAGKPFCLNVNISDPHKPFWKPGDKHPTSRVFKADEVPVPGFLHDDPVIREELALYYSSVRRADDCAAAVIRALDESGMRDNTVIFFLSDHGMPLPFAKTQLYHHSTRTPLVVHWPGVTKAGSSDEQHMVSAVDFLPTLLDIAGIKHPEGLDGRSFLPLIKGKTQEGRDVVFKEYNENSGAKRNPMRAVESRKFLYLFNPWSNGEREMGTATNGTATWKRMNELAKTNPEVAERVRVMRLREVEELYDIENDPDCLNNLATNPEYADALKDMRSKMEEWMEATGDHALEAFEGMGKPAMEEYVQKKQAEADERRKKKRAGNRKNNNKNSNKSEQKKNASVQSK